jgi:sterol desaturase/sphingolipid hydroxylase (fatty acid hydroxylase superfamily)
MAFVFATIACLFVAAERLFPIHQQPFVRRGFFTDLLHVVIHFGMRVVINGIVAVALVDLARLYAGPLTLVSLQDRPLWLQTLALLLVLDFVFYVIHRLKHRWHWWWRLHETHHSSVDLDWLSGARFHPLEKILDRTIFLLPLTVMAPSDGAMLIWA